MALSSRNVQTFVDSTPATDPSFTNSYTVGDGTEVLVAHIRLHDSSQLTGGGEGEATSVTYGGQALHLGNSVGDDVTPQVRSTTWLLENPPTGANDLVVNTDADVDSFSVTVLEVIGGADTIWALGNTMTAAAVSGTDRTGSLVTAAANSLLFGNVAVFGADTDPFTPATDNTELADGDSGGGAAAADHAYWVGERLAGAAGSYTLGCTAGGNDNWTLVGIEIREAGGPVFPHPIGAPAKTATENGNSLAVNLPSGIQSGELLLVFVAHDTDADITQSGGSDWTRIDNGAALSNAAQGCVFAKVAAGSDTLTLTDNGDSQDMCCVAVRIDNHGVSNVSTDITLGTAATGNPAAPDPPNCNPGVADNYLWLEYFAADDDDIVPGYASANYTPIGQERSAATTTSCSVGVAYRMLNASSEDPGTMTLQFGEEWRAQTLAIPPAAAGSVTVAPGPAAAVAAKIDPTPVLGSISFAPAQAAAVAAKVEPTIIANVTLSPAVAAAVAARVDPAAVQGSLSLSAGIAAAAAARVDPAAVLGSLTLSPAVAASAAAKLEPGVINDVVLAPAAAFAAAARVDPAVVQGSLALTPAVAAAAAVALDPATILGALTLAPAAAAAVAASVDPTVEAGADVTVAPAAAVVAAANVDPQVLLGSLTIVPGSAAAVAARLDPAVTLGAVLVVPANASAVATRAGATVVLGDLVVFPAPGTARALGLDPATILGSISVTALAEARAGNLDPAVVLGSIALSPAVAGAIASALDPVVVIQGATLPGSSIAAGAARGAVAGASVRVAIAAATAAGATTGASGGENA